MMDVLLVVTEATVIMLGVALVLYALFKPRFTSKPIQSDPYVCGEDYRGEVPASSVGALVQKQLAKAAKLDTLGFDYWLVVGVIWLTIVIGVAVWFGLYSHP